MTSFLLLRAHSNISVVIILLSRETSSRASEPDAIANSDKAEEEQSFPLEIPLEIRLDFSPSP